MSQGELLRFVETNRLVLTVFVGLLIAAILVFSIQARSKSVKIGVLNESGLNIKNNQDTFLVIGAPDSGKTSLFQYLSLLNEIKTKDYDANLLKFQDLDISTTKSFKLNLETIKLPFQSPHKSSFLLVDIPGDDKIFNLKIKELISNFKNIKGVIFMVNAAVHNNKINSIAKKFFNYLILSEGRPNGIDTLVAINKTDLFGARNPLKFKEILEKEINEIKNVSLKNLKSVKNGINEISSNDDDQEEILEEFGNVNVKFQFDTLEGNFDFIGGSLHKNKIENWVHWIDERAVN